MQAFCFELGKVEVPDIRTRMVGMLAHVDETLAQRVAQGLGLRRADEARQATEYECAGGRDVKHSTAETGQETHRTFAGLEYGEHTERQHQDT